MGGPSPIWHPWRKFWHDNNFDPTGYYTKDEVNTAIDNIQIGGRNLYKGTKDLSSPYWFSSGPGASIISSNTYPGYMCIRTVNNVDFIGTHTSDQGFDFSDTSKIWTISADKYVGLGKTPAYTSSSLSIPTGSSVTIAHNLGYHPIVRLNGTVGNLIVTTQDTDVNHTRIYCYSNGGATFNGYAYFY